MKSPGIGYTDPNRLADVMALIQVLARGQKAYKSEQGLLAELQGFPKSKPSHSKLSWIQLAQQHSEFFRVRGPHGEFKEDSVSLISRHVLPKTEGDQREPLPPDYTGKLLDIAISLHDREATRRQQRTTFLATFIPIGVAIIAGLFSIAVVLLEIAHHAAK